LYSFPDSLGDDLLVEVQDSKGKHFGRVLVQVATIADDPVILYGVCLWVLLLPVLSDDHMMEFMFNWNRLTNYAGGLFIANLTMSLWASYNFI